MKNYFKINKYNLLLLLVILIIFFFFAEILTRIFYPLVETGHGYPRGMFIPDDELAFKLNPGFEGYFTGGLYRKTQIKINSNGLRDYEYDNYSEPVILGVGDSVTFGSGIKLNETYLALLENKLDYKVIKAGVAGYEFVQYLNYIKGKGIEYKPDLVIIGFVLNDINQVDIEKTQRYIFRNKGLKVILKNCCQFCTFVWRNGRFIYFKIKRLSKLKTRDYYEVFLENLNNKWQSPEWEITKNRILELVKLSKKENFKLLFVIFPFRDQLKPNSKLIPQKLFSEFMEQNNLDYIDFYHYLYEDCFLPKDGVHLNLKGTKIVSEVLYKHIHLKCPLRKN